MIYPISLLKKSPAALDRPERPYPEKGSRSMQEPTSREPSGGPLTGIIQTDLNGIIQDAWQARVLLQRPPQLLINLPLGFCLEPPARKEFYRRLSQLNLGGVGLGQTWESQLRLPAGQWRAVTITTALETDHTGKPCGYRWLLRDITELKRLEQSFLADRQVTDSLLSKVGAILLDLNSQERIVRCNAYLFTVCDYKESDLLGWFWQERLVPPEDWGTARALLQPDKPGSTAPPRTTGLLTKKGQRRVVSWSAQRLPGIGGEPGLIRLMGRDITELKKAQARAAKTETLANLGYTVAALAHEGRNALQRSQACLDRLRWRLEENPEALELTERALKANQELGRLFEDVLLCAATVRLSPTHCDLAAIWQEAWTRVLAVNPDRQAVLNEQILTGATWCQVDPFRLGQVFRNLFENSFAACTEPVQIDLCCQAGKLEDKPAFRISIRDNGPGLTPEQRQHLFEEFYTTKPNGNGLGMIIARTIIEAHGGRIAVGETVGPGTEIVLLLPRIEP